MIALAVTALAFAAQGETAPRDLGALLREQSEAATKILENAEGHRLQILVAEVVPTAGRPVLRRSRLGDGERYFYPASSIKLCGAVAAMIELHRINGVHGTAFDLHSPMVIGTLFDGDAVQERDPTHLGLGRITVGHDIRQLCLVSNNQAFNDLYEFVGHRRLNECMREAGYPSCRIFHRLSEFRSRDDQRRTRPVTLMGPRHHEIPSRTSDLIEDNTDLRDIEAGTAHISNGQRVEEPLSFRHKNAIALEDLQDMLAAIIRPDIDTGKRGFPELSVNDRQFLVRALGELPRESENPVFPQSRYPDHHTKFLLPGVRRVVPSTRLRIYTKIGRAYGFSTTNAYVEDQRTGKGFFVAAVLYTNPNGVLNDDTYGYEEIADPFFADLGEALAQAVFGAK